MLISTLHDQTKQVHRSMALCLPPSPLVPPPPPTVPQLMTHSPPLSLSLSLHPPFSLSLSLFIPLSLSLAESLFPCKGDMTLSVWMKVVQYLF